ncbi:hypothetical protein PAAG_12440 [Paracoccidioides lutzii Pb01]|uniref:Uncharacterized protein n=1 Tax=Paracoccidioides lutzii (strain ATCC MYA-826 / Pb01) TaxID=502779 RepID=A0A0A2V3E0_PARBA|nr:hypothetical protein PAAG_12440 [Paracoccidioides lutzii Pb01]KGQ00897.1 hypothetical protein PAAG_12440 [Paracoccidioides lutzii Pb01]
MNLSEKYLQDDRPTAIGQQSALECFNHETFKAVKFEGLLRTVEWRESEDEYCRCRIKKGSTHARVVDGFVQQKQINDASGGEK